MAKSTLAFAALDSVTPAAPVLTGTQRAIVTVLHSLPKTRTASPKALAFNYASLFDAGAVGAAFNDHVITQAISGRVCHQFVKLSATLGLIVPTGKAQFDTWSSAIITDVVAPFKAHGKSVAYGSALILIRETLGLSDVGMGAWSTPKPKAPAKAKSVKAPSKATITEADDSDTSPVDCAVSAIVASLDALTMAQLETLQAAIAAAMAKIAPL